MTRHRIIDRSAGRISPESVGADKAPAPLDLSRLNAVRLIVVLIIGVGYASTMSVGPGSREWLSSFGYDPSLFGLQVLFFFSGWLALRSLENGKSVRQMLVSRAERNLPWVMLYTLIVVAILYPVLCDHDAPIMKGTADLAVYFLKTVTLVDPGAPMPGALDGALYMCLLQGTIWTLRIGVVGFLGLGLLWLLNLRQPVLLLLIAMAGTLTHIGVAHWTAMTGSIVLEPISAFLYFGYPFLIGVAAYAFKTRLPNSAKGWGTLFLVLLGLTLVNWYALPWTQAIQPLALLSYCALAMMLVHSRSRWLQHWPNLVLPTYLGIWPITQTILYFAPDVSVPELVAASLACTLMAANIFRTLADLVGLHIHGRVQTA